MMSGYVQPSKPNIQVLPLESMPTDTAYCLTLYCRFKMLQGPNRGLTQTGTKYQICWFTFYGTHGTRIQHQPSTLPEPVSEIIFQKTILKVLAVKFSPALQLQLSPAEMPLNPAQDINGFPPNFHPPDSSSRGIHKDSMGFKWFHQQSIGVICGKPKIFIEVGDELWHWFHMFYIVLSRYWSWKENPLQRHTFESLRFNRNPTSEVNFRKNSKVKAHRSWREKTGHALRTRCLSDFGAPKSHGHHPPGFVQKCGTDRKYSSQIKMLYIYTIIRYNRMMLYITGKMMLIFLFHLICSLDYLSSSCTPSPCNWLISMIHSP